MGYLQDAFDEYVAEPTKTAINETIVKPTKKAKEIVTGKTSVKKALKETTKGAKAVVNSALKPVAKDLKKTVQKPTKAAVNFAKKPTIENLRKLSTEPIKAIGGQKVAEKINAIDKKGANIANNLGGKLASGGKSILNTTVVNPTKDTVKFLQKPSMENLRNGLLNAVENPINTTGKILTGKDKTVNIRGIKESTVAVADKTKAANDKAMATKAAVDKAAKAQAPANTDLNHFGIERPTRFETLDANGNAKKQYQLDYMKERSMSPYAMLQQKNLTNQYNQGKSDIVANANASAQGGFNSLARQGGITSGARVSLFNQANQNAVKGQQDLASSYQNQMSGVIGDDYNRQLAADEKNIGTSLNQVDQSFGAKKSVYDELLRKNASDYMADAIANQGQGNAPAAAQKPGGNSIIPGDTKWGSKFHSIYDGAKLDPIFKGKYDPLSKTFGGFKF